jgi:hypothetical protein
MVGVDWRCCEIVDGQHSAKSAFQAADAEKPAAYLGFPPERVMNHIIFPTSFVTTAPLASAWRRIHSAVFTDGRHVNAV